MGKMGMWLPVLLVILSVLPEDDLAEVREVDEPIVPHLVSHVYGLLLRRVESQGLHGHEHILRNSHKA